VRLPAALESQADKVEALYQFELLAAPRGSRSYLSRRVAEEDSSACRTHAQLTSKEGHDRSIHLSSVFLANRARVNPQRKSLAYAITIAARVPDYQVERRFWADQHYEGGNLYRDTAIVEMTPPDAEGERWKVGFCWMSETAGVETRSLSYKEIADSVQIEIPFASKGTPGIGGILRLVARPWNT
jgi:hypothetical protein